MKTGIQDYLHTDFSERMKVLKNNKNQSCVMVCVTPQQSCSRLIEAGARIAKEENLPLTVVSVFRESSSLDVNIGGVLENLFACSQKYQAAMNVYFNDSPALVLAVFAKKSNASTLVTGFPGEGSNGFIAGIHELLPEVPITMVDGNSNEYKIIPFDKTELENAKKITAESVH